MQACPSISEYRKVSSLASGPCSSCADTFSSGGQYQLLDWLQHVTFPTEAKFSDAIFAQRAYESVVRRVIDAGVGLEVCCKAYLWLI